MADITVTAANVSEVLADECRIRPRTAAAALTAGQAVYYNSSGKAALTDTNDPAADLFDGINLETVASGGTARILEEGNLEGFDLSGVALNGDVFLADTPGALATAVSSLGSGVRIGRCDWRNDSGGTFTKFLRVDRSSRNNSALAGATSVKEARLAITGAALHAGVLSWTNFEAGNIDIIRVVLQIVTASSGASTVDIGTTATSATTQSDNLINGLSGATAGVFDNITDKGTNGKSRQTLATGKWVTVKEASGDVTGMVATLIIQYIPR